MFDIKSITNTNQTLKQIDILNRQMELVNNKFKNSIDKNFVPQNYKYNDTELTNENLAEDEFNSQRVGSAEFTTSNSSSDETNESNESSSDDDSTVDEEESALSHSFRQMNNRGTNSINRTFKANTKKEDLFLSSLEVDRFASKKLYMRNRNNNDLEQKDDKNTIKVPQINFDDKQTHGSIVQNGSYCHNSTSSKHNLELPKNQIIESRTIKAATRFIDAQGKKTANLTKQQSQSMVNLSSNLSVDNQNEENQDSCSGDDRRNSTTDNNLKTLSIEKTNHATSAIRPIIESQYAVLQHENELSRSSLEMKKRKKQNKLKMSSYLHQNNEDILKHGQISPIADCSRINYFNLSNTGINQRNSTCLEKKHNDNEIIRLRERQNSLNNNQTFNISLNKNNLSANNENKVNSENNVQNFSSNTIIINNSENKNKLLLPSEEKPSLNNVETLKNDCESSLERKSQQFNCLPSRTSFQNEKELNSRVNTISNQLRSLSIQAPDCPLERVQFYKFFAQTIRRGRKGLQNMDSKFMNEHQSKFELVYKQELRDLIWLEIKAWMDNRSTIEQDYFLCFQRNKIPKTLEKLMKFSVNFQVLNENNYQDKNKILDQKIEDNIRQSAENIKLNESKINKPSNENVMLTGNEFNDLKSFIDQDTLAASVAIKLTMNDSATEALSTKLNEKDYSGMTIDSPNPEDDCCNCSETLSKLCQYCVDKESTALDQVNKILSEIDEIEQLYPCVKALAIEHPLYEKEQFVSRIKSLYLYQNIIRDVREKINLLAKLFHIQNREAAGWPNFHDQNINPSEYSYNTSSDCTPEIFNISNSKEFKASKNPTEDAYTGYSYKLNAPALVNKNGYLKQVHFHDEVTSLKSNSNSDLAASCLDSPDANISHYTTDNGSLSSESKTSNPFFPRKVSIYRRFVDKALKHKGLRYIYHTLSHILRPLLYRVHAALKKPALLNYESSNLVTQNKPNAETNTNCELCLNTKMVDGKSCDCDKTSSENNRNFGKQNPSKVDPDNLPIPDDYSDELSEFGVWSIPYQQMGLPTFHRPFFFLLRVTIDVIHECLILRLEQQPEQPSNVSVGQLIRECKEVIKAGVQIKQLYINLAQIVLGEAGTELFEAQLDAFNDDLKTMLIIYLKYLENYMVCMQSFTSKSNSTLKQKGYLEQEWSFVRSFCPYIPGGEALSANKFCVLASDLLTSIGDYIQKGVINSFEIFKEALVYTNIDESCFRKGVLSSCRSFKLVFQEANAKVCQATAFAKSLRKDLEIAAEYQILTSPNDLFEKLKNSGHIRVIAPNCCNHLLFIPSYMQNDLTSIWQLLDMTCGGKSTPEFEHFESTPGYLLITSLPNDCHWTGTQIYLEPTPEVILSLSHIEANGVFFLVNNPSLLTNRCRQFSNLMMGNLKILKHQTSCNSAIANALTELKHEALKIQEKTANSLDLIYKELHLDGINNIDESDKNILQMRCLDVLHQGFKFTFEYEKALTRLITGDSRVKLAKQLIKFAHQWITFVVNKCEKARGLRARWVIPGLQYLVVALEPQYIQVLSPNEFKFLKDEVDNFLTYVLGSKERSLKILLPHSINLQGPYSVLNVDTINKPLASSLNFQRSQSVVNVKGMFGELHYLEKQNETSDCKGTRLEDWLSKKIYVNGNILHRKRNKFINKLDVISSQNTELHSTIGIDNENSQKHLSNLKNPFKKENSCDITSSYSENSSNKSNTETEEKKMSKIRLALKVLDDKRDLRLKEKAIIGSISDLVIPRASFQVAARKVNFPWQRGFKIGEGRFGKVYTAVNNSTGELIAMKEIHLQHANDNRAIKETIDEIMIFEGIKHFNLVKYFGVEIHRNELYIFMEYCNEGSLESAVQLKLPEQLVRKYTRQLLEAVNCLHENGIVHRDIKSANIFLTLDGNLKLGDFGCCMKLKNHSTMPGELNTLVGTPAYMAPEMFTRNSIEGHGRFSDIWSIGCVVLEMLTGRRPWHDLENAYQIMFKVGMGETPEIPNDICSEGKSFINHCLRQDPRLRWSTGQLLGHPFTKVCEEDDLL